jgi:hypothetical protein
MIKKTARHLLLTKQQNTMDRRQATPGRCRRIGTSRNLGASPTLASTSSAARSSSSKVSGTPSSTLTTQSRQAAPRTAQSSQSIFTGPAGSGGIASLSDSLVRVI